MLKYISIENTQTYKSMLFTHTRAGACSHSMCVNFWIFSVISDVLTEDRYRSAHTHTLINTHSQEHTHPD